MALRTQHTDIQANGFVSYFLQRNVPARGFKPAYYMIGMHVIMAYGFYKYFHGVREQRYVSSSKMLLCYLRSTRENRNWTPMQTRWQKKEVNSMTDTCLNDSELAREKIWSRLHLTPLLQAEEDRDQVRRHYADKAREKELLGTDAKVYNSDRYVPCKRDWTLYRFRNLC